LHRCLQFGLKSPMAPELLAHIVQQRSRLLGFTLEAQQFSAGCQEQGRFIVAPTVLIAHNGVDASLCHVQTPGQQCRLLITCQG
jgi:hypothetical protein